MPLTVQPESVSPPGNVPVIEQVYGDVPPVAPISEMYGTPTVPFGSVFVSVRAAGAITMVSF